MLPRLTRKLPSDWLTLLRLWRGATMSCNCNLRPLHWCVDPHVDLAGLRYIESLRVMAPYGQLVAWRHQPFKIQHQIFYLPGPNDPITGEPADLMPEQRVRRETNIVYLVDEIDLADFRWVREWK